MVPNAVAPTGNARSKYMNAEPRKPRAVKAAGIGGIGSMLATLVAAVGCIMAVVPAGVAEPKAADLSGRWVYAAARAEQPCVGADCGLTYDLVRCGDGWCGIEVKDGKDCGRTALRLDAGATLSFGVEFFGRYEKAQGTEPYAVNATLQLDAEQKRPLRLSVRGNTGGTFQGFRRIFPLQMVFKREGEPGCRADPKLS